MWWWCLFASALLLMLLWNSLALLQVLLPSDLLFDGLGGAAAGSAAMAGSSSGADASGPGVERSAGSRASEDWPDAIASSEAFAAAAAAIEEKNFHEAFLQLSSCGQDFAACDALRGELLLIGEGTERNHTEALRLLNSAAQRGDASAQFSLGALHANAKSQTLRELHGDEEVDGAGSAGGLSSAGWSIQSDQEEHLSVLQLYAASLSSHPGAQMAMGYRHLQGHGVPKSCSTAALNYIEVARRVADVYTAGMPQAVELVRLGLDNSDTKAMSPSEVSVFVEIALAGDAEVAAAVGKRYLLGIDGFRQSYGLAARHLLKAAEKSHGAALALLGYMYCLGLGVERNLEVAYSYFVASVAQGDALGHNGLGYIYFHGSGGVQKQDLQQAVLHFNASAHGNNADGMFNLASLYLTGVGVPQSFQRAAWWFTLALDRGHTPAAYALAVMQLNGLGTVRNCKIAVDLLKRVAERGNWVSQQLQEAYDHHRAGRHVAAAWLFLRLAEAGHEVAQMNLAHLLETGAATALFAPAAAAVDVVAFSSSPAEGSSETGTKETPAPPFAEARSWGRVQAQRHLELSAEQGNVLADLRLGDYAYYGWGLRLRGKIDEDHGDLDLREAAPTTTATAGAAGEDAAKELEKRLEGAGGGVELDENDDEEDDVIEDVLDALSSLNDFELVQQEADYSLALARYQRTASVQVTGEWMQPCVARANFNVGFMHHFGIGTDPDPALARRYYNRCLEVDPVGVQAPVTMMLALLSIQAALSVLFPVFGIGHGGSGLASGSSAAGADMFSFFFSSSSVSALLAGEDLRVHLLIVNVAALLILLAVRAHFRRVGASQRRAQRQQQQQQQQRQQQQRQQRQQPSQQQQQQHQGGREQEDARPSPAAAPTVPTSTSNSTSSWKPPQLSAIARDDAPAAAAAASVDDAAAVAAAATDPDFVFPANSGAEEAAKPTEATMATTTTTSQEELSHEKRGVAAEPGDEVEVDEAPGEAAAEEGHQLGEVVASATENNGNSHSPSVREAEEISAENSETDDALQRRAPEPSNMQ